ncbi:MAG: hypothetical protein ACK4MV_09240 [Beijerinckiaceae bacterium]
MTEAAVSAPPAEATRDDLIQHYRALLATPHSHPDCAERRRVAREGLTLLGASPFSVSLARRRLWLVSTHFRAPRPKGRLKRL